MKTITSPFTRQFAQVTALGLAALTGDKVYHHPLILPGEGDLPPDVRQFSFGMFLHEYENVLGTSMELIVQAANPLEARECEMHVLGEIERLRRILSTYDPASEIRQVMAGAPVSSPELSALLNAYTLWAEHTNGVINVNLGEVLGLWKSAIVTGRAPSKAALRAAAAQSRAYNVDALGKGFIIDRAVEVARRFAPSGLLNIGGDIRVWGRDTWLVGVANPLAPAENDVPLAQFYLREGAVATSGGYARNFAIAGQVFSHVLDPRSLRPVSRLASATVVAKDCLTANALSTAACVLNPTLGLQLLQRWGALEHLIVDATGPVASTGAFAKTELPAVPSSDLAASGKLAEQKTTAEKPGADKAAADKDKSAPSATWPKDHQVTINVSLKTLPAAGNRAVKRPYVAIWVENVGKKHVRTIAVWGNSEKYLPSLTQWWQASTSADYDVIKSVTRATRAPGQYRVTWDGLDDKGKGLPTGDYKIFVEINREHGRHVTESAVVHCAGDTQTVELLETTESDASKITYGPAVAVVATEKK